MTTESRKENDFSFRTRQQNLTRLADEKFDYVIVGGGITGAGIARDAAMRGRKVALIEKNDFASGTSSRSSKLVHGGVRYLETFEFGLVYEASTERRYLLHMAPFLVKPLPFLMPIYKGAKNGFYLIMAGMWLYDILSLFKNIKRHKMLRAKEVLQLFPSLRSDGLTGAPRYYDCGVDDARLTLATIMSAHRHGAVVANYTTVTGLVKEGGRTCGVVAKDALTGNALTIRGDVVISALGPWTDEILKLDDPQARSLMRPTKGIHFVIKRSRLGSDHALAFFTPRDNRLMFLIPWGEFSLVGTTDTDYHASPDSVYADANDVDYVLDGINAQFAGVNLKREDIISTYAGVRPLVAEGKTGMKESKVSREHKIWETPSGLVCIAGGKLTTYRSMAKQLVDVAERKLAHDTGKARAGDPHTDRVALTSDGPAAMQPTMEADATALARGRLPADVVHYLLQAYGAAYPNVMALLDEEPLLSERLVADLPYIKAEIVHAVRQEMALTLLDVMARRLHLLMEDQNQGLDLAEDIAALVGREIGWTADEQARQVELYRQEVERTRAYKAVPVNELVQPVSAA